MAVDLRRLLQGPKDVAVALAARTAFNARFQRIGKMTELAIDTKNRVVRVQLDLVGEPERIEIRIGKYELEQSSGGTTLKLLDVTASRPWIAEALREFVVGRSFEIPSTAGALLKLLA
jgi:hypothetical protein